MAVARSWSPATMAAVERALEIAIDQGRQARHAACRLSAPFHCRLMQPAADVMAKALADVTINRPASPLVSNVLAAADYRSRARSAAA